MNFTTVYLDTTPLGLASQRRGKSPEADACKAWVAHLVRAGVRVVIPEIADYEVRRELIRASNPFGVARLVFLRNRATFLPLTSAAMEQAAELWAKARNEGWATADPHALDGDVILAAQVITEGENPAAIAIATSNVAHISRYVPNAYEWKSILP